jgi:hypothetical protein
MDGVCVSVCSAKQSEKFMGGRNRCHSCPLIHAVCSFRQIQRVRARKRNNLISFRTKSSGRPRIRGVRDVDVDVDASFGNGQNEGVQKVGRRERKSRK